MLVRTVQVVGANGSAEIGEFFAVINSVVRSQRTRGREDTYRKMCSEQEEKELERPARKFIYSLSRYGYRLTRLDRNDPPGEVEYDLIV